MSACKICGKQIEGRKNDPLPGYLWYVVGDPTTDAAYCGEGTARHIPDRQRIDVAVSVS